MVSRSSIFPFAVTAVVALASNSANAADIEFVELEGLGVIAISGEITSEDPDRFRRLALQHDAQLVALDSPGGNLVAALEIGKAIRVQGYATIVLNDTSCVSACALTWLAGTKRFTTLDSKIGFHASYYERNGELIETGAGNALVGHYLSSLGFSSDAVLFATSASPYEVTWLEADKPDAHGINFEVLDSGPASSQQEDQRPATARQPKNTFADFNSRNPPDDFIIGMSNILGFGMDLTKDGLVWISANKPGQKDDYGILAADLYSQQNNRMREVWVRGYHIKNADVQYRTTKTLYRLDCERGKITALRGLEYDAEDELIYEEGIGAPKYISPGTYGDTWRRLACFNY